MSSQDQWKKASEITEEHFMMLQNFVKLVKQNYKILDLPPLQFFKDWLEKE